MTRARIASKATLVSEMKVPIEHMQPYDVIVMCQRSSVSAFTFTSASRQGNTRLTVTIIRGIVTSQVKARPSR